MLTAKNITNGTKENVQEKMPIDYSPKAIKNMDGDKDLLNSTASIFQEVEAEHEGVLKQHNKIMRDPTENKHKNSLRSRKVARTHFKNAGRKLDNHTKALDEKIGALEYEISSDLKNKATAYRYGRDFTQLLRQTENIEERRSIISGLMKKGNRDAVASIIDAPEELTGLTEIDRTRFRDQYERTFFPDHVSKRETLRNLKLKTNNLKRYLLETIQGGKIYDHGTLDRLESLQA